jgi:hypothetical protein
MILVICISKPIHKNKGVSMNREPWVAYLVVIGVVAAMMYGKYLMGSTDEDNNSTNSKDEESK